MLDEKLNRDKLNKLKAVNRDLWLGGLVVVLSVFACYCVIWAFTEQSMLGQSQYMSYVLQARRWLGGHLDLDRTILIWSLQ